MLLVLLAGAAPVRAASITFEELVRTVGANGQLRPADEVRLRLVQSGRAAGQQPSPETAQTKTITLPSAAAGSAPADPTLSQSGGEVQTIDIGDVTGTVCDCGEIAAPAAIAAGGFPWWPFLGVPLICASGICFDGDEDNPPDNPPPPVPTPTTTPNTPTNPIPEPTTLLLFGTGLLATAARARRRRGRRAADAQADAPAEEVS